VPCINETKHETSALLGCYAALIASQRSSGTTYQPHLQASSSPSIAWPHNIPEERKSHLHRGGNLKLRKLKYLFLILWLISVQPTTISYFQFVIIVLSLQHLFKRLSRSASCARKLFFFCRKLMRAAPVKSESRDVATPGRQKHPTYRICTGMR
jgi:hypothetical protein